MESDTTLGSFKHCVDKLVELQDRLCQRLMMGALLSRIAAVEDGRSCHLDQCHMMPGHQSSICAFNFASKKSSNLQGCFSSVYDQTADEEHSVNKTNISSSTKPIENSVSVTRVVAPTNLSKIEKRKSKLHGALSPAGILCKLHLWATLTEFLVNCIASRSFDSAGDELEIVRRMMSYSFWKVHCRGWLMLVKC